MVHLLVVDDEILNLRIIQESLEESGFLITEAESGEEAWDILSKKEISFSAIILDRLMPGWDGIEVLKKIQSDPDLSDIPVILQTALGSNEDVLAGLQAGAFYYLTKPYSKKVLVSIINLAVDSFIRLSQAKAELFKSKNIAKYFTKGEFTISNFDEMIEISPFLSNLFPDPSKSLTGIIEIISNAIEHGNLEIGFELKQDLQIRDLYHEELKKRFNDPRFQDRKVEIKYEKRIDRISLMIEDSGNGFDYKKCDRVEKMANNLFQASGRGILIAKTLSFDELTYIGKGNIVEAITHIK